jgi:hypothetical protein
MKMQLFADNKTKSEFSSLLWLLVGAVAATTRIT